MNKNMITLQKTNSCLLENNGKALGSDEADIRELSFFTSGGGGGGKWGGDHMKIFPSKGGIIRKFF